MNVTIKTYHIKFLGQPIDKNRKLRIDTSRELLHSRQNFFIIQFPMPYWQYNVSLAFSFNIFHLRLKGRFFKAHCAHQKRLSVKLSAASEFSQERLYSIQTDPSFISHHDCSVRWLADISPPPCLISSRHSHEFQLLFSHTHTDI